MSVPIAARLAEALNLPGNPVAAVDAARDKFATRAIMQDAGLATPANKLIEKAADLDAAAAAVGFPAVRSLHCSLWSARVHARAFHLARRR